MSARARAVAAAQGAVGTKFRPQGRDPAYGLDCVGLAGLAMRAAGHMGDIPNGYDMRGGTAEQIVALIDRGALVRVDPPLPGDVLLFAVGPAQFHLAVKSETGIVHADAMLRRVVERPGVPPWPMVAAWMLIDDAPVWDLLSDEGEA